LDTTRGTICTLSYSSFIFGNVDIPTIRMIIIPNITPKEPIIIAAKAGENPLSTILSYVFNTFIPECTRRERNCPIGPNGEYRNEIGFYK